MNTEILRKQIIVPEESASGMGAYLAQPAEPGKYPGVIVGMELFGVTRHIRSIVDRIAELGYIAIAPDFYHSSEAGVELSYDQAGRTRGFELLHQTTREQALMDVAATMDYLRLRPDFNGRTGFLGFSVGGHIAYLAATQFPLSACAIFYAGWLTTTDIELSQPEPTINLTVGIAETGCRILYIVGENDALIPASQRETLRHALESAQVRHEIIIYPDVMHGFFCDERETFNQDASNDAWKQLTKLFDTELRQRN